MIFFLWDLVRGKNPFGLLYIPWKLLLFTTIGIGLYRALYFVALKIVPPVEASLINYLWPVLIVFFSIFLIKEKIRTEHFVGLFLGFAGLVVLLSSKGELSLNWQTGHLLAFLGAIVWAVYSVFVKVVNKTDKNAVPFSMLLSGALFYLVHLQVEPAWVFNLQSFFYLFMLGVCSGGGYYLWATGMKSGNVKILSISAYFIPLLSTILLIAFDYAQPSWNVVIATVLIFLGPAVASKDKIMSTFKGKK